MRVQSRFTLSELQRFMPVFLLAVLLLASCAPAGQQEQGVPVTASTSTPAAEMPTMPVATMPASDTSSSNAPAQVRLMFRDSAEYGQYLVDEKGMALYLFTKDTPGVSNCEGDCLVKWPPLLVPAGGDVQVDGADSSLISTITRSDGSTQVTFNGWPLYYWINDKNPGDTTGQGVGSVWYLLDPSGNGIGMNGGKESSSGDKDTAGSSDDYPKDSAGASASRAPEEVKLMVREDPSLGRFLVDEKGMTLYLFTKDTPGVSNCEGDCLVKWPPLLVAQGGKVEIDGKDEEGLVGTITRSDGTLQVTYKDMPLYYWINDKNPGDTTGQNVGGVWFVVEP